MGIRHSLLLSLILHVALIFAVIHSLHFPKEGEKVVRLGLGSVRIEEAPKVVPKAIPKVSKRKGVKAKKQRRYVSKKGKIRKKEKKKPLPKRKPAKKEPQVRKLQTEKPTKEKNRKEETPPKGQEPALTQKEESSERPSLERQEVQSVKEGSDEPEKAVAHKVAHKRTEESYQEVYRKENLSEIRDAIASHLRYPPIAVRMGWEGTVIIRIILMPDGGLAEASVEKSSGYKILDATALEAVTLAHGDFPKPRERVTLVIPVVFSLEK